MLDYSGCNGIVSGDGVGDGVEWCVCDDVGTWPKEPQGGPQQSCRRVIHFVCLCVVSVSFFLFI